MWSRRRWRLATLSLRHCRELLGETAVGMTDEEVEGLRDQVYRLARVTIEVSREGSRTDPKEHQVVGKS